VNIPFVESYGNFICKLCEGLGFCMQLVESFAVVQLPLIKRPFGSSPVGMFFFDIELCPIVFRQNVIRLRTNQREISEISVKSDLLFEAFTKEVLGDFVVNSSMNASHYLNGIALL